MLIDAYSNTMVFYLVAQGPLLSDPMIGIEYAMSLDSLLGIRHFRLNGTGSISVVN